MSDGCHGHEPTSPSAGLRVVLAGNPNVGKSSLFNRLTGAQQHVGNWPGKTVERREGRCRWDGRTLTVVDLPGTYSLAATSPEERIAEQVLTDDGTHVVVAVLDTTNLERNLYLAAQLAELGRPLVLALNLHDVAVGSGVDVDAARLGAALGAATVHTNGRTGEGLDELLAAVTKVATATAPPQAGAA